MRILKGYTDKEIEEFKILSTSDYPVSNLSNDSDFRFDFPHLNLKLNSDDEWKFLTDLAEYHNGNARFPERLYYVKFSNYSTTDCLNLVKSDGCLLISDAEETDEYQTKFTMPEIKELGEKYVPFAVPVDEVEE